MKIHINSAGFYKDQDYRWVLNGRDSKNHWEDEEFRKILYSEDFGIALLNQDGKINMMISNLDSNRYDLNNRLIRVAFFIEDIEKGIAIGLIKAILPDKREFEKKLNKYIVEKKEKDDKFGFEVKDIAGFIDSFKDSNARDGKVAKCYHMDDNAKLDGFDFDKRYIFIYSKYIKDGAIDKGSYSFIYSDDCERIVKKKSINETLVLGILVVSLVIFLAIFLSQKEENDTNQSNDLNTSIADSNQSTDGNRTAPKKVVDTNQSNDLNTSIIVDSNQSTGENNATSKVNKNPKKDKP
jgi:hypothetical protein